MVTPPSSTIYIQEINIMSKNTYLDLLKGAK